MTNNNNKFVILHSALLPQPFIDTSIQSEILNYINNYRTLHNAPNLVWDNTIDLFSQNWANYLLTNNLFQHSGSTLYGENLAYFNGYDIDALTLIKLAIDMWYNEIKLYDFSKPGFSENTGHFTCLIWKESVTCGIGYSYNTATKTAIVTMNTFPPGNIDGKFQENVLPPIMTPPNIITPAPIILPPPNTPVTPVTPVTPTMPNMPMIMPSDIAAANNNQMAIIIGELYNLLSNVTNNKSKNTIISNIKKIIVQLLSLEL